MMRVLIPLLILMSAGCSTSKAVPKPLLVNQPVPDYAGKTYRDVVEYGARMHKAALSCEADRSAIKKTQE